METRIQRVHHLPFQVPQEVCGHSALKTKQSRKPKKAQKQKQGKPSPKKVKVEFNRDIFSSRSSPCFPVVFDRA